MLRFHWIDRVEGMGEIEEDWHRLQDVSHNINVFQTFEWVKTWWKHFGSGREARVLFAWDGEAPLLSLPLEVSRRLVGIPVKRVSLLGADRLSTCHEPLFSGGVKEKIAECFTAAVERFPGWDYFEIKKIPDDSPLVSYLRLLGNGKDLRFVEIPYKNYPYIQLTGDFESFMDDPSRRSLKRNLRKYTNKMEKSGEMRVLYPSEGQLNGSVEDLIHLAEKGWKYGSGFDPLQEAVSREFFREILPLFHEKKMLALTMLELDGSKIAAVLCFALRGRLYGYYKVFDEAHRTLSPDRVTLAHAIEKAFAQGFCEMDFSEGEEDFKLQWTKTSLPFSEIYILNRRSPRYPILLSWLSLRKKAKTTPTLKKWISRLRKL